jgi:YidC/Oxa1 family membrane protein insertase
MESGRVILAIALSFVVFLVWDMFFTDKEAIQKAQQQQLTEQQATEAVKEEPIPATNAAAVTQPGTTPQVSVTSPVDTTARTIVVDTPLYSVAISEKGAAFNSFKLKEYREAVGQDSAPKALVATENQAGSLLLRTAGNKLGVLEEALFQFKGTAEEITVAQDPREISFEWVSPDGVVVEKKYTFNPESYRIGFEVNVKNTSDRVIQDKLIVSLRKFFPEGGTRYGFLGASGLVDNSVEKVESKDVEEQSVFAGDIKWITIQDRYFMSSLLPVNPHGAEMRILPAGTGLVENQYVEADTDFNPGTQRTFDYEVFFGPKSMKVLSTFNNDLDKAINFGMFDILAKPCLWLMNYIHDNLIPNYGIAIIILTLLTKLLLWPLGSKSYKSMAAMKKLQPLMAEIKEKYKGDKKKMNEETMALYRTYKVNPMGGCLPMVVQIPVFFALYRMLYEAIELRHAPFFGWINDLSAPDRLLSFDFAIPMMEPPYGIPVLTIVMGASMFLQQKMSPPMGDATQAKMMMFMPIIFTVIFINFSAGLVLYWLVNNIISIAQQYYIQKKTA